MFSLQVQLIAYRDCPMMRGYAMVLHKVDEK